MTQQDRFATMFAAIDYDGRRYVMAVPEGEYKRVQEALGAEGCPAKKRAHLRLVSSTCSMQRRPTGGGQL